MSGQFHPLSLHPLGNTPRYQLYRKLSWLQSRSGIYGEEEHLLFQPGTESRFLACPARSLFAAPHDLAWLTNIG
jgi:hypothetical protein